MPRKKKMVKRNPNVKTIEMVPTRISEEQVTIVRNVIEYCNNNNLRLEQIIFPS